MTKKVICFFAFLIVIIVMLLFVYQNSKNIKENAEAPSNNEFGINQIYYYSSVNANSNTVHYQNPEWNVNVYQYTDIAIYLNRLNEIAEKNYISSLSISNISVNFKNARLYYLNPRMFGNGNVDLGVRIENDLDYTIINSENKENEQNYTIPIFFQDCSNPITLRIINDLANNYTVSKDDTITYNGSLIQKLGVSVSDLTTDLSFDLQVTTKDGNARTKRVDFKFSFENEKRSILDGDFEEKITKNVLF